MQKISLFFCKYVIMVLASYELKKVSSAVNIRNVSENFGAELLNN